MSDSIISVEKLSKCYVIGHQRSKDDGFRHLIEDAARNPMRWLRSARMRQKHEREEFWALNEISFEIHRGDVVGIIGRNGAGKSTLLKILSRITEPTSGRICIDGRVASLLEVGTGFHPELTGRENIFLNGAILGMSRVEIKSKFDEIVAFSEVERFLDTHVKRYSSGMYVRLAFAVAAHLEPEILIVDEVLAVGDAQFQKKCLGKMQEASTGGRTVLFVSHNMGTISSLCARALWIDAGKVRRSGEARSVVNEYLTESGSNANTTIELSKLKRQPGYGDRLILESVEWNCKVPLRHGEPVSATVRFRVKLPVQNVSIGIGFATIEGTRLLTYETDFQTGRRPSFSAAGTCSVQVEIDSLPLAPGIYILSMGGRSGDIHAVDYLAVAAQVEVIPGAKTPGTIVRQDAGVRLASQWTWEM